MCVNVDLVILGVLEPMQASTVCNIGVFEENFNLIISFKQDHILWNRYLMCLEIDGFNQLLVDLHRLDLLTMEIKEYIFPVLHTIFKEVDRYLEVSFVSFFLMKDKCKFV